MTYVGTLAAPYSKGGEMRWRLEWIVETLMIPIWLVTEWLEESGWAQARAEAKRDLTLSVPGDWEE